MLAGYFVLGLAAVLSAGALAFLVTYEPPHSGPLDALRPCRLIVGGATRVYVCRRTGHVYALQGGDVVDLGPVTSGTMVPQR